MSCLIYQWTKKLLTRSEIDDPLDSTQVHGLCGFWSIVARGIFDRDQGLFATGTFTYLGIQILGGLVIALWAGLLAFFFFATLKE